MLAVPSVPAHHVRWGVSEALLVIVGTQLVAGLWGGLMQSTGVIEGGAVPSSIAGLTLGNLGLWVAYGLGPWSVARSKGEGAKKDFGLAIRAIDVPLGLVVGIVAQLVILPAIYIPVGLVTDENPSTAVRELIARVDGDADRWLLVLVAVVLAPLFEEFAFRGLVLRALQRSIGPLPAALASASLFAIVHFMPLQMPGLFVFGVLAAGLALWSGRLGPSLAMHVGFNATALIGEGLFSVTRT